MGLSYACICGGQDCSSCSPQTAAMCEQDDIIEAIAEREGVSFDEAQEMHETDGCVTPVDAYNGAAEDYWDGVDEEARMS